MPTRMEFEFGSPRPSRRPEVIGEDEGPAIRVAAVADFAGRASAGTPIPVDIDSFDRVIAKVAPAVSVVLPGVEGRALDLAFANLDAFHPDALLDRVEFLGRLLALRAQIADPAAFAAAAAHAGSSGTGEAALPASAAGSDLERLLGGKPAIADEAPKRGPDLRSFFQAVVGPHVVPGADPRQGPMLRSFDDGLATVLRHVLHDPAFKKVEGAWRSLHRFLNEAGAEPGVEVRIVPMPESILLADLGTGAARLADALAAGDPDQAGWDLILVDGPFGARSDDLARLEVLGALAARYRADVAATASPALLGCASLAASSDPATWSRTPDAVAAWEAFRRSPAAENIHLGLPRLMIRRPYGAKSDPADRFPFEEWTPGQKHEEAYLWGGASWALGRGLVLERLADAGVTDADPLDLDDLPAHVVDVGGEAHRVPPAEVLLGERAVEAITRTGLVAVLANARRDAARLSGLYAVGGAA